MKDDILELAELLLGDLRDRLVAIEEQGLPIANRDLLVRSFISITRIKNYMKAN
jgi:hypothetical protein